MESLWVSKAADFEGRPEGDSPNLLGLLIPGANLQATFPQHPLPWGGEGREQTDQVMAFSAERPSVTAQDALLLLFVSTVSAFLQALLTTSRLTESPGDEQTGGHSDPRLQCLEVVRTPREGGQKGEEAARGREDRDALRDGERCTGGGDRRRREPSPGPPLRVHCTPAQVHVLEGGSEPQDRRHMNWGQQGGRTETVN